MRGYVALARSKSSSDLEIDFAGCPNRLSSNRDRCGVGFRAHEARRALGGVRQRRADSQAGPIEAVLREALAPWLTRGPERPLRAPRPPQGAPYFAVRTMLPEFGAQLKSAEYTA